MPVKQKHSMKKRINDKAPVEGVNIVNIASINDNEKRFKINQNFNYIIKIANFYYERLCKFGKRRIMSETNTN